MNGKRPYEDYLNNLLQELEESTGGNKSELNLISLKKLGNRFNCNDVGNFNKSSSPECTEVKKYIEMKWQRQNKKMTINNTSALDKITKLFSSCNEPDTIVLVQDRFYACHSLVLTVNSLYLRKLSGESTIDLRNTPVTPSAFEFVYKWMLKSVTEIRRRQFLPILRTIYFLEVPPLMRLCLDHLNGNEINEIEAFYLAYSLGTSGKLSHITQALTPRISESCLIVMCSFQFLQLTKNLICYLLQSNFLAVNTECEILFGALHWLDVDWPSRSNHVVNVLKCIRFAFLSPKLLKQLLRSDYENIGRFRRVLAAFHKLPESRQLIEEGIFHNAIVINMKRNSIKSEEHSNIKKELLIPRRWMQDTQCVYHRPVTKQCPNMHYITYSQFVQYSKKLQATIDNYNMFVDHPG